jgi:hypothetical protein
MGAIGIHGVGGAAVLPGGGAPAPVAEVEELMVLSSLSSNSGGLDQAATELCSDIEDRSEKGDPWISLGVDRGGGDSSELLARDHSESDGDRSVVGFTRASPRGSVNGLGCYLGSATSQSVESNSSYSVKSEGVRRDVQSQRTSVEFSSSELLTMMKVEIQWN